VRVVVTGAAGRIGRAVWGALAGCGHHPVGLDLAPASTVQAVGDIGDAGLLERMLDGADAVIHTAALHAPHVGLVPDDVFERTNVQATALIAAACARRGIRRLVFTSTTALYGHAVPEAGPAAWIDEDTVPRPRTVYHRTKLAAEALLRQAAVEHGLAVTVLRMSRCFPESAPAMAVYRLHRGVDARDVAAAHVRAVETAPPGFRLFVVSGTTPFLPVDTGALGRDAAGVIAQRAPDLPAAFAARGWRLPARIDRVYDAGAARADLGWSPRFGFAEVLAQMDRQSLEVLPPGAAARIAHE